MDMVACVGEKAIQIMMWGETFLYGSVVVMAREWLG